jgi:DeoR family lactose phosphotransferase system repressor
MKEKRIDLIMKEVEKNGIVSVSDLMKKLRVTRMTVGRDLKLLEDSGMLKRIHGGAVRNDELKLVELTHLQKKNINMSKKEEIGKLAAEYIENGDVIFIGASTTNECLMKHIKDKRIRIITNSFYIFEQYKGNEDFELILTGGSWRERSGAFIGEITDRILQEIKVDKSFIGANGIKDNNVTNSNKEEASLQKIIMNNSQKNYILIDSNKFDLKDLYTFYRTDRIDGIVTDSFLSRELREKYGEYTEIIINDI